ncbi:kinase-like protein [Xylariaceae sp. FL1651]|nr:kinase-like protein [Xylariaceae sp. FL1651]
MAAHNDSSLSLPPPIVDTLCQRLYRARQRNPYEQSFIPNDDLDDILSRETISQVIVSLFPGCSCVQHDKLLNQIDPQSDGDQNESRKKLFGILILRKIPGAVIHFIEEDIWDRHLPFHRDSNDEGLEYHKDVKSPARYPILCSRNFSEQFEYFELSQRLFLAPSFDFNQDTAIHYRLHRDDPLPFIHENERESVCRKGGFSQVYKVLIHPAHHNLGYQGGYFAVKQLLHYTELEFNQEVNALNRVRKLNHPHLLRLLATYSQAGSYYLIFQWADSDLRAFWEQNPGPLPVPTSSRWMLDQCLGIAKGLRLIHSGRCTSGNEQSTLTGRHGDIKAANILLFAQTSASHASLGGILAISDFGLTKFHQQASCHRMYSNGVPATRTYRAPEGDLKKPISHLWDHWPLGCLYLEFIIWLLQGWDALEEFVKERAKEDHSGYPEATEDKFFNIGDLFIFKARRKKSVSRRIAALHGHPDCTELLHEFLDLISEGLLRIRANKRAICDDVIHRLEQMNDKCKIDEAYYTEKKKRFTKRPTNESDKSSPMCLSRATEAQRATNISLSINGTDISTEDRSYDSNNLEVLLLRRGQGPRPERVGICGLFALLVCCKEMDADEEDNSLATRHAAGTIGPPLALEHRAAILGPISLL